MKASLLISTAFFLVFISFSHSVCAENIQISVPKPIGDFINSLQNINIDSIKNNVSNNNSSLNTPITTERFSGLGITNIWNQLNNWMEGAIGISISQIIRIVGNFIVWVFDAAINVLKDGLNKL